MSVRSPIGCTDRIRSIIGSKHVVSRPEWNNPISNRVETFISRAWDYMYLDLNSSSSEGTKTFLQSSG